MRPLAALAYDRAMKRLCLALGWCAIAACGDGGDAAADTHAAVDAAVDALDTSRSCGGTPRACHERIERASCEAGDGCTFQAAFCAGTALGCASLDGARCAAQPGCAVDAGGGCAGDALPCAERAAQTDCGAGSGCAWAPAFCGGVPLACASYAERATCQPAPGCAWQ